jgi:DNA-binding transcriptional MocR family regulator
VSLISPLAATGRADEVVQRVSQAIQLGLFTDGEQLPPETDFAAQLGVSDIRLVPGHAARLGSARPDSARPDSARPDSA